MNKSAKECALLCDAIPGSVAFEHGVAYGGGPFQPGHCQCQISIDSSGCPGRKLNLDLYIKHQVAGYTRHPEACVRGHNIAKYTGKSLVDCAAICDATAGSVAFEYGVSYGGNHHRPGDCHCQDSSDSSACHGKSLNLDLYVRDQIFGYTRLPEACVRGHNIATYTGKSLVECASICAATARSIAFEFGVSYGGSPYRPGDCSCQDSVDSSDCSGRQVNLDLYVNNTVMCPEFPECHIRPCPADIRPCPGGGHVIRDVENDCKFPECPIRACFADIRPCLGGGHVVRDIENDCKFPECPIRACHADIRPCPGGGYVERDSNNECKFPECPAHHIASLNVR